MTEESAKIAYLDSLAIDKTSSFFVGEDAKEFGIFYRLRLYLLRLLLNTNNGIVYVFSLREKIIKERATLDKLKKDNYIEEYGEGVVYADYPRLNFFGITFRMKPDGGLLRSWGYSLPFEDKAMALKKALWETCERQATYFDSTSKIVDYPKFKKGDASFLFDLIPHFSTSQLAENTNLVAEARDLKETFGLEVKSLTKATKTFIPASCLFWGSELVTYNKVLQDVTTSGSGGGSTRAAAILASLYELIERDLFLLFWFSGIKPRQIDIEKETGPFFSYLKDARKRFNLDIYFLQTTYDIAVPACVCIIFDPVLNLVAMGSKVCANSEDSLRGAYLEALATLSVVRSRDDRVPASVLAKIVAEKKCGSKLVDKKTRVNLYSSELGLKLIKELWIDPKAEVIQYDDYKKLAKDFASSSDELVDLVAKFTELIKAKGEGYHIYVHEFSSVLTKEFDSYVCHAYIPALLKLHLNETRATPLSVRLNDFALYHGKKINSERDLNCLPHPFP